VRGVEETEYAAVAPQQTKVARQGHQLSFCYKEGGSGHERVRTVQKRSSLTEGKIIRIRCWKKKKEHREKSPARSARNTFLREQIYYLVGGERREFWLVAKKFRGKKSYYTGRSDNLCALEYQQAQGREESSLLFGPSTPLMCVFGNY